MRQRGRPRHPDLLTPREWEVLSLVREGLSNREIGDRLGVSRDGIKYHISQILPKLNVSTREEAAAWQPGTAVAAPQPAGLTSRLSGISRVGLIGAAGALLAGLVALGGAVVYSELSGGTSNDSAADALGGGPPTASPDAIPTPSPDHTPAPPVTLGDSLGFVAYVKDGNLWVLNLDTGDDRLLVERDVAATFGTTAVELTAYQPEWSADGSWISLNIIDATDYDNFRSPILVRASDGFAEFGGGNSGRDWSPVDLVVYGDGALERPIGSFPADTFHGADSQFVTNVGYGEAKWSPDGTRVAVSEALITYLGNSGTRNVAPPYRVSIVDPTSAQPTIAPNDTPAGARRIFEAESGAGQPIIHSWSPDGEYILFWTGPGDAPVGEMTLVSVDNPGALRPLGPVPVAPANAAWSPDGSTIAFVEMLDDSRRGVHILRMDGVFDDVFESGPTMDVAWSPDSSTVVYSQDDHIRYVNPLGNDAGELTHDDAYVDRYPQWSHDGSRILFIRLDASTPSSGVATVPELWLMDSDGTDAHKVIDLAPIDLTQHAAGVDWTKYLSWYKPNGIGPLATAAPPSPAPTFGGPTPPFPDVYTTPPPNPQ